MATKNLRPEEIFGEARLLVRVMAADRPTVKSGVGLMLTMLFIILYYWIATAMSPSSDFAAKVAHEIGLGRDESFLELVNYGVAFVAATNFMLAYFLDRSRILVFATALSGFIWFDDSSSCHERVGYKFVEIFDVPSFPGLMAQDTGELLAWLIAAVFLVLILMWAFAQRRRGDLRIRTVILAIFAVLVFFATFYQKINISRRKGCLARPLFRNTYQWVAWQRIAPPKGIF
jgi:hypothetical protein